MAALSTFTAKYRGQCAACPAPIEPGDEVVYHGLSEGLVHAECPPDLDTQALAGQRCPRCFAHHPGEC